MDFLLALVPSEDQNEVLMSFDVLRHFFNSLSKAKYSPMTINDLLARVIAV